MPAPVALLLPGHGAQYPGMGARLYAADTSFRTDLDGFFALMGLEGERIRADWLSLAPRTPLDDASRAQPLLFAIGCALGSLLIRHGVQPIALLGHSIGELAAAALSGVFTSPAAAGIMLARSAALATAPRGGMLAVAAAASEVEPLCTGEAAVAAVNAPRQTVVAAPAPQLRGLEQTLHTEGLFFRRVAARQPFHCPALVPAAIQFERGFAGVPLRSPQTPIYSTRTGKPLRPAEAVDAEFWAGQLSRPVLFWPALDALLRQGPLTLVEAGPPSLSVTARRHSAVRAGDCEVIPLLPGPDGDDRRSLCAALDRLTRSRAHTRQRRSEGRR